LGSPRVVGTLKGLVPGPLRPLARDAYRGLRGRWLSWATRRREQAYARRRGLRLLPPAELRARAHGYAEVEGFVEVARRCADDIEAALRRVSVSLKSFEAVLDFGCGCGRQLLFFADRPRLPRWYGTDIDGEAVAWCRRNLKFADFRVNQELPPLSYAAETFDLMLAVSVFTHLDEDHQRRWLEELRRVAKPGAIFLCTVHGEHIWRELPAELRGKVVRDGFLFVRENRGKGTFPDWYQMAYQTEEYVRENFGAYFEVIDYIPRGMNEDQDTVILHKR
jgi:SAM-dependent methyltransferase